MAPNAPQQFYWRVRGQNGSLLYGHLSFHQERKRNKEASVSYIETEKKMKSTKSGDNHHSGIYGWVLMPTCFKLALYWFVVVVGSFIHDFLPLPQSYFSNKRNVLNVYFVKFGWGWTLLVLIPFISLTSSVYTSLNPLAILKHLSRMAVATWGWYFWVNLFVYIEELTGFCEGEETLISKRSCYQEGFYWDGFDISGHSFLSIYSALVIKEELQAKLYWPSRFQHRNIARLVTPLVDVFSFFAALLLILWEFMLVFTTIYFHTVYQKVLGALIAIFTWYITYRVWYHNALSPGLPWVPND
ncbi:acyl-coenzyme A diphosphatase FITM2 [Pocillopora verrucosa]|uniref:acyl-coenzyme A diphosphatase FITM2 n=1 Tax=Pocillopora verrucosa TaxID=203993 RepID=UPI00333E6487